MTANIALETKRQAVAAHKRDLAAPTQAAHSAQKQVDVEASRVQECEKQLETARDRATYDAALIALESARKDHTLAVKRSNDKRDELAHAQSRVSAAEHAVVNAVDNILLGEIVERTNQVKQRLDEVRRLGSDLKYFTMAGALHAAITCPAATEELIAQFGRPLIDGLNVPINLEKLGDIAAFRDWSERRARMIAGETAFDVAA